MPQLSSKLTFPTNPALKLIDAASANRLGGAPIHCPDSTTLEAWRVIEAQNVVDGLPIWAAGQWVIVATDPPGTVRVWDGTSAFATQTMGGGSAQTVITLTPNDQAADVANRTAIANALAAPGRYVILPGNYYVRGGIACASKVDLDLTGVFITMTAPASDSERTLLTLNGAIHGGSADGSKVTGGVIDANFVNHAPITTFVHNGTLSNGAVLALNDFVEAGTLEIVTPQGTITDDTDVRPPVVRLGGTIVGTILYGYSATGTVTFNSGLASPIAGPHTVNFRPQVERNDSAVCVKAERCEILGVESRNFQTSGFLGENCSHTTFRGCRTSGTQRTGIWCYASGGRLIERVTYDGCYIDIRDGYLADWPTNGKYGSVGLWIYNWEAGGNTSRGHIYRGNTVIGPTGGFEFSEYPQAMNIHGPHNVIENNLTIGCSQGFSEGPKSIIRDNSFLDLSGQLRWGVEAFDGATVESNTITGARRGVATTGNVQRDVKIRGNKITTIETGVEISSLSYDCVVEDNDIYLLSSATSDVPNQTGYGIQAIGKVWGLKVRRNQVYWRNTAGAGNNYSRMFQWRGPADDGIAGDARIEVAENKAYGVRDLFVVFNPGSTVVKNLIARDNEAYNSEAPYAATTLNYLRWMASSGTLQVGENVQILRQTGPDLKVVSVVDQKRNIREWADEDIAFPIGNAAYASGPGSTLRTTNGKLWLNTAMGSAAWRLLATKVYLAFDPVPDTLLEFLDVLPAGTVFTRAAASTVTDWEALTWDVAPNDPRFARATRRYNLLIVNDLSNGYWVQGGGASLDAGNSSLVNLPSTGALIVGPATTPGNANLTGAKKVGFSAKLSGSGTISLALRQAGGGPFYYKQVTLSATPTTFAIVATMAAGMTFVLAGIEKRSGDTATAVTMTDMMAEDLTGVTVAVPGSYVPGTYPTPLEGFASRYKRADVLNGDGTITRVQGDLIGGNIGLLIESGEEVYQSGQDFQALALNLPMWTIRVKAQQPGTPTDAVLLSVSDGTANNRITLSMTSSTNLQLTVVVGGVTTATINATVTAGALFNAAIACSAANFALCVNGGAVSRATSGATPQTSCTRLNWGSLAGGGSPWGGIIQEQAIHLNTGSPTDAQMQTITT